MFGLREAAWPLVRADLNLSYEEVGLLLTIPGWTATFIELVIGVLGDSPWRRALIRGGGLVFFAALALAAFGTSFAGLMVAFILFYPASGAFVNLSQAALMDHAPTRHEQNMARWTLAGSVGMVAGPLLLGVMVALGPGWRGGVLLQAALTLLVLAVIWRFRFPVATDGESESLRELLTTGFRGAWQTMRRREVLRWLALLQFSDLLLDVLHGYLALYFVDVAGTSAIEAGLAVGVWTGVGLVGDVLLLPLLERVRGVAYLRFSALFSLVLFSAFLLVPGVIPKLVLLGLLGFMNAGWYAILQAQLYSHLPGQSGSVMALSTVSGLVGSSVPLVIGLAAAAFGLQNAFWLLLLGPVALLVGLPRGQGILKPVGEEVEET